eukprot:COSAG06_NODE_22339_length_726_cov_2.039872_2_plen_93_part_00
MMEALCQTGVGPYAPESSTCLIDGVQATAKRCCENQILWLRNESKAGTPLMVHGWQHGAPGFFLAAFLIGEGTTTCSLLVVPRFRVLLQLPG